jgi:hypothetical protein
MPFSRLSLPLAKRRFGLKAWAATNASYRSLAASGEGGWCLIDWCGLRRGCQRIDESPANWDEWSLASDTVRNKKQNAGLAGLVAKAAGRHGGLCPSGRSC